MTAVFYESWTPPQGREGWLRLLVSFGVNCAGIFLAAWIVPGVSVDNWYSGLVAAGILGALNAFIRPILTCLTCAITILTLGFFLLVINAAMLAMTAWVMGLIGLDFEVDDFWAAFFGALVITLVSLVANIFIGGISPQGQGDELRRLTEEPPDRGSF